MSKELAPIPDNDLKHYNDLLEINEFMRVRSTKAIRSIYNDVCKILLSPSSYKRYYDDDYLRCSFEELALSVTTGEGFTPIMEVVGIIDQVDNIAKPPYEDLAGEFFELLSLREIAELHYKIVNQLISESNDLMTRGTYDLPPIEPFDGI